MNYIHLLALLTTLLVNIWHVDSTQTSKIDSGLYNRLQKGGSETVIMQTQSNPNSRTGSNNFSNSSANVNPFQEKQLNWIQFEPLVELPTGPLFQLINRLNALGVQYVVLWDLNQIIIFGAWLKLVLWLVDLLVVVRIMPDVEVPIIVAGNVVGLVPIVSGNSAVDYNNARCSDITRLGDNVVVGIISTGVVYGHPELALNWKNKTFGYFDGTNITNSNQPPADANGAGTAALSIVVGKTQGMAPNAKWIACKGCRDDGACSMSAFLICAQYMLCPWDNTKPPPKDQPQNCQFRPNVVLIQNWSYNYAQLLDAQNFWFYDSLQRMHSAKIITVTSIGDTGPICNGAGIPAAYDIGFAVGAVDLEKTVLDISSRGPSLMDGSRVTASLSYGYCPKAISDNSRCTQENNPPCIFTKPDILALGYRVNAASNDISLPYAAKTGTLYAAAQVAGTAVLVLSNANPTSGVWNQEKMYKVITENGQRNETKLLQSDSKTQTFADTSHLFCDYLIGKNCTGFPSNVYGYGVLNTCATVFAAKKLTA